MKKQESKEDYLEAILKLTEEKGHVRSIDVVRELGYSKPSISVAMKHLKEENLILIDSDGFITLTPAGLKIAGKTLERERLLTKMLVGLGVNEEIAKKDACELEHCLHDESWAKLKEHILKNFE